MLSGFELCSRWVPLNLANKFVNLHCLLMLMGSFIINLNMNLINSRSQIVFRTDIFRKLSLGTPVDLSIIFDPHTSLPACRRLLFPLLQAEKGRLRNAVANRVPASCWVPKILGTRCDRLTHSAHCLT